jgi:hypothetical protein
MKMRFQNVEILPHITRRQALGRMGSGFGWIGLAGMMGSLDAAATLAAGPLDPKPPHFPAKATRVIFLFLNGGLSHVDTFDPKPMLDKYNGQPMPGGNPRTERKTGNLMRSPFEFRKHGQSGIEVSEIFSNLGAFIDDFCVIRSMYTNVPNHEPSLFMMNCGDIQPGRPSMGSWITYGLGTENQNLPGFVVLCPGTPVVGPPLWNSAFLPGVYQGTHIVNHETDPNKVIPFIHNSHLAVAMQRQQVDLVTRLNRLQIEAKQNDPQLEAGIQSMEIAFRMQTEAPEVFNIEKESEETRKLYGEGDFARGCLMARRLVEHGVRVVQIYFGNSQPWDNHDDILVHRKLAQQSDRPIAALIRDLKSRGLLDETLVIVGSEFGRTPSVETSASVKVQNGRDHNSYGFSLLLAGGGIKGGITYGATDDFGFRAVEHPVHVHDLHATILHLLGFDHTRLTYRYSGRDFRLTDVHGEVVKGILA